ncbi:glycosyltransferase family 1 protein [Spongiivirga citrea]|uniref:Glycosyltransferase n=1 Tax=Spongiivirga citrea TaxID=1481457 RepID=A0A6M0CJF7_9FLAO|nr:glycosyltransferase family 1 protein [Spongiivirga citrea]NER15577.1 glycosyltransferase [Spongiivirga citrea]
MVGIRVLQVFTIMDRGGAESMIMNYYRALDRSKIQFDFLVHREKRGHFDDEIEKLGGQIFRMNPINPFFPNSYYVQLRSFFETHKNYKIVHSHINTFSYFTLKIAQEFGLPHRIAHAHIAMKKLTISDFFLGGEGLKDTLKKIIKLRLRKRIHQHANYYYACGNLAGNWLFGKKTDFGIMNNAVNSRDFQPNTAVSNTYKKEFGIETDLIIGHVGRFVNQKNHHYLLKVFKEIVSKKSNCKLILIGDGPLRQEVEHQGKQLGIDTNIYFLGVRDDIPQLYQMMDVFIFPSLYEGLPVTLVEAQAAGLKIFASDSITPEIAITDDIKFLSITEAPNLWAKEVLKYTKPEKKNNIELVVNNGFDIVENARAMESFYLGLNS